VTPDELESRLAAYLAIRQAMGYAMRAERTLLADFVTFLVQRAALNPIRAQAALDWASQSAHKRGLSGTASRLTMARRFLLHLRASYPDTEIPGLGLVSTARRPTPFLFTDDQIGRLAAAARNAGPQGSLRPHALATFLGLLASTGLRVGEAARLSVMDVQLSATPARLLVRETKFGKSRWVPLHPTTAHQLAEYLVKRRELSYDGLSEAFFVSEQGRYWRVSALGDWFGQLVVREGLWPERGKRWPSLRSFRHTFAVGRLRAWYEEGADVRALVPRLAIYLGHVSLEQTYWYLTATPELLGAAAKRFSLYAGYGEDQ
jgi:integrase/recombinase XerD